MLETRRRAGMRLAFPIITALLPATGTAAPLEARELLEYPRTYANLRVGSSSFGDHTAVCAEVAPFAWLGLEGCGNGAGFLHRDNSAEIAHFRAKLRTQPSLLGDSLWWSAAVAGGFAELQTGGDEPGFNFTGVGANGNATAGPEAGASFRLILPLSADFELLGETSVNAAWFEHAPQLRRPRRSLQVSVDATIGIGF